jgi:GT2 family glycosyltransferase
LSVSCYILHCASPNSDELLKETYDSLQASDYPIDTTIVTNGVFLSGYESVHQINIPENIGFARGINTAIDHFLGTGRPYVLLLNNDTFSHPRMVSHLVSTHERFSRCGIVSPRILFYGTQKIWFDGGVFNHWTGAIRHKGIRKLGPADSKEKETDWATACCWLVKREVIEEVGLLNPEVSPYGEDVDYCLRAKAKGWKVMVNPRAILEHKISQSIGLL